MKALTQILKANGFSRTSSSSSTLRLSQGSVTLSRWEKTDNYGKTAVVQVRQVNDAPEVGTLQPGTRRACANIVSAEDLQKALDYHGIDIIIGIPQMKKGGDQ